jgi:transglutaminase-like putative cysteine protease
MKFSITHEFKYAYDSPVRLSTQYLRLTPRDTMRQKVLDWKLDTPGAALRTTDGYGNVLHVLTIDKPVSEIAIQAQGTVGTSRVVDEPSDFTGTPLPPLLFLRSTGLTRADEPLRAFAEKWRGARTLAGLRALAAAIHDRNGESSAADTAHEFIACCRHLGVPARYVSGYFHRADGVVEQEAAHAWAEAKVPDLGWVGFDPVNGISSSEAHVRVAVGLDYLGAAPIRGSRYGGGSERLGVKLTIGSVQNQVQMQA